MRKRKVHYLKLGSTKTLCGRNLVKVNYTIQAIDVTCESCLRILDNPDEWLRPDEWFRYFKRRLLHKNVKSTLNELKSTKPRRKIDWELWIYISIMTAAVLAAIALG